MNSSELSRRSFVGSGVTASAALALAPLASGAETTKRIRVGIIGCGSVSTQYFPHLAKCPYAEIASACDIIPERAVIRAKEYNVQHHYPHIDKMLAGVPFDLLVNLTDMQEHEHLNRQAIETGKHIWSEKPIANSLAAGQELLELANRSGVRVWGAPTAVNSPQFAFMAKTLNSGGLGRVAAAHADYGHTGPNWSSFFYEEGGGSMPDLGVYNLTSLTGLLGPARSVVAMTSIVTPTRDIDIKGRIQVTAEDNAMVVMDHGNGMISHVQCGFNFFNPHGHDGSQEQRHTISIVGSQGIMGLVGYDWDPRAVDLATEQQPNYKRYVPDKGNYVWQQGASVVCGGEKVTGVNS
jgi:predicted dehydrogenase